jgi:uncharacterized damage-inducible protein DinB
MTPEQIQLLYEYNAWASHRLLDACAALTEEQFTRSNGSSFPSVRDTLVHIMGAEWVWLERWQGRLDVTLPSASDSPGLADIRRRWAQLERDLLAFVAKLTAEDLAGTRNLRTLKGEPYALPLWQLMQHVVNHGSYHRGQVTTMLRQLGASAVATDLVAFYRERAAVANS